MSSRNVLIIKLILFVSAFVLLLVSLPIISTATTKKQRVLILHSFHKGQKWNDDLSRGIVDVLKDSAVEIHFEYMDAKRNFDERHFTNLYNLYRHKYRSRPVDVVISTDESALDFLLAHREDLFPGAFVVFCGIKFLEENKLYGESHITGLLEQVDIEKNIQLILKLTPKTKHILVITDNSPTSISTIKSFIPVLRTFKDRINFHFTELMAVEDLQTTLQKLSKNHAVLLVNYTKDINGKLFSMKESALTMTKNSPVPVYALWDSYLGNGILGGLLVSGVTQGKMAAHMAQALLKGGKIEGMPVQKSTLSHYMFDFQQLKKFGIAERKLPVGSVVINRPVSFYYQHKILILTVFLGILGLTLIILVLSINIVRRRRVEKSLKIHEEELRRMSAHIIEAQETERKRLSIELHDEFGQILTAVGLNLSLIRNKLGIHCSQTVAERLDQTESDIENLYDQIHNLSLDLRPTILDDLGLTPTLRWCLNQFQERSGKEISFLADEDPHIIIPGPIAVTLYRILQETLTNITKYADATTIKAHLTTSDTTIELIISDNGVGFNLDEIRSRKIEERGLGLVGMRERLDLLDGSLKIKTAPGRGTTLHAIVPIHNKENDG